MLMTQIISHLQKQQGTLLARFAPPVIEWDKENFWLWGDETSDLHKNSPGAEGILSHRWKMTMIN